MTVPTFTTGDRLRKAREHAHLTQRQLAERIGVDKNTVSNYEADRTKRRQRVTMRQWAAETGVPLTWIADGTDDRGLEQKDREVPIPFPLADAA